MIIPPLLPSLQVASMNEIFWITPHNPNPFYIHGNILTLKTKNLSSNFHTSTWKKKNFQLSDSIRAIIASLSFEKSRATQISKCFYAKIVL